MMNKNIRHSERSEEPLLFFKNPKEILRSDLNNRIMYFEILT